MVFIQSLRASPIGSLPLNFFLDLLQYLPLKILFSLSFLSLSSSLRLSLASLQKKNSLFASHQKITVKYKIDGALNQNTNSNHNFKINQIRTKKKKRAKLTHLSLGGERRTCGGGRRKKVVLQPLSSADDVRERKKEREFLECFGEGEVLEKKRKKKSEDRDKGKVWQRKKEEKRKKETCG